MAKMIRSYEEWKKSETILIAGKGCTCSCSSSEGAEGRYDGTVDFGGCSCAPGTEDNIND